MTRTAVWVWIVVGTLIYGCAKLALGMRVPIDETFPTVWWSALALVLHWMFTRKSS